MALYHPQGGLSAHQHWDLLSLIFSVWLPPKFSASALVTLSLFFLNNTFNFLLHHELYSYRRSALSLA